MYKNSSSIKFASSYENGISHLDINRGNISPEDAYKIGAIPFENNAFRPSNGMATGYFSEDISKYAMLAHSIVFPALQFILYTGISKLYIVGCDGGWTLGPIQSGDKVLINLWREFKCFAESYYKDVDIISINPVSLKGWFEDEFS